MNKGKQELTKEPSLKEQTLNEENIEEEKQGLSFKDIVFIIRKHIIAIIIFILVGLLGGTIYNFLEVKNYEATATMIVSPDETLVGDSTSVDDYQYSSYISKTYVTFISEDVVLDEVSSTINDAKGLELTSDILRNHISATLVNSSLVISLGYTSTDSKEAQYIVNILVNKVVEVANATTTNKEPKYKLLYDNIAVLSEAKEGKKVSHTVRNIGIGFAIGFVVAIIYVCVREALNTKFKSPEEVESVLGASVIGVIPFYDIDDVQDESKGENSDE